MGEPGSVHAFGYGVSDGFDGFDGVDVLDLHLGHDPRSPP